MQASSLIIHQQHPQTKTKETHFTPKQKVSPFTQELCKLLGGKALLLQDPNRIHLVAVVVVTIGQF
jgi:regulatory protein YycI of two-component signal transduction system YycFG